MDTDAINSTSCLTAPPVASDAPNIKSGKVKPRKFNLAKFIVEKYVLQDSINWPRDVKIANKLVEKYPELAFWNWLGVKFQCPSMAALLTKKSKRFLEIRYSEWNKEIERNKKIIIVEKAPIQIDDKIYSDYNQQEQKPLNRLEFLQN